MIRQSRSFLDVRAFAALVLLIFSKIGMFSPVFSSESYSPDKETYGTARS
jgi:hypothetical protein